MLAKVFDVEIGRAQERIRLRGGGMVGAGVHDLVALGRVKFASSQANWPASVVSRTFIAANRKGSAREQFFERYGRRAVERAGIGFVAFADADGVDDDEMGFGAGFGAGDGL